VRYSRDPEENLTLALIRRQIMRDNLCIPISCTNPKGENCVCWKEFREAIATRTT
jgi:hypothetical protein